MKSQAILSTDLLSWVKLDSDPAHSVSIRGETTGTGTLGSMVTPFEEAAVQRPALLYATTVVYTVVPGGRGVER